MNSWFVPLLGGPLDGIMQPLAMPPAEQLIAERVLRFENSLRRIWACRKRLPLAAIAEESVPVYELSKTSNRWEYQFVGYDSREAPNTELIRPELMSPFGLK